jgi:hypothetical protein
MLITNTGQGYGFRLSPAQALLRIEAKSVWLRNFTRVRLGAGRFQCHLYSETRSSAAAGWAVLLRLTVGTVGRATGLHFDQLVRQRRAPPPSLQFLCRSDNTPRHRNFGAASLTIPGTRIPEFR